MADLSKIKLVERKIDLKDPGTGEPVGLEVTVMSMDDPRMKGIRRKIQDRKNYLQMRGKDLKAEEIEENQTELTFRAMTGWKWGKDTDGDDATWNGEKLEFNRANVLTLLREAEWMEAQIIEVLNEDKGFFTSVKAS